MVRIRRMRVQRRREDAENRRMRQFEVRHEARKGSNHPKQQCSTLFMLVLTRSEYGSAVGCFWHRRLPLGPFPLPLGLSAVVLLSWLLSLEDGMFRGLGRKTTLPRDHHPAPTLAHDAAPANVAAPNPAFLPPNSPARAQIVENHVPKKLGHGPNRAFRQQTTFSAFSGARAPESRPSLGGTVYAPSGSRK